MDETVNMTLNEFLNDELIDIVSVEKKTYINLMKRVAWLECLEQAGVDNWEGISYAYELYHEEFPEEE